MATHDDIARTLMMGAQKTGEQPGPVFPFSGGQQQFSVPNQQMAQVAGNGGPAANTFDMEPKNQGQPYSPPGQYGSPGTFDRPPGFWPGIGTPQGPGLSPDMQQMQRQDAARIKGTFPPRGP